MSWLDDIGDIASSVGGFFKSSPIISGVLSTVMTGYALNKVTSSIAKDNQSTKSADASASAPVAPDLGNRLQLDPDSKTKIPVIYGTAFIGGKLVDARMADSNQTMWYCLVLSEVTGTLMSTGAASIMTFNDVYWNNGRIVFDTDGVTAIYTVDKNGKVDRSIAGLVRVYCYKNGSTTPAIIENYSSGAPGSAYALMPSWTSSHTLNSLCFALVKITYSKEKNVNGLGQMQFKLTNSMTKTGDCLKDYMTNTRYGAGIPDAEIKSS